LGSIEPHQRQIRHQKLPLRVRDVAGYDFRVGSIRVKCSAAADKSITGSKIG
jgi:hypothetical protein